MAESVLKDIFPFFEDQSTTITRDKLALLHNVKSDNKIHPEIIDIVLKKLDGSQSIDRVTLLKAILNSVEDENIKKATIQELVRLKTGELSEILAGYLRTNKENTPSKIEAIRALGRVSIKRYLERR